MEAPSDTTVRVVLTTAPDASVAESLANRLVEEGHAACVNVLGGVTSIYRWQGQVERAAEVVLIVKTTEPCLAPLAARLVELHPYDVPEMVVLDVSDGHGPYLEWVRASVGSP